MILLIYMHCTSQNKNNADFSGRNIFALIVLKLICVITDFGHIDVISQNAFCFFPSFHPKGTLVQHTQQRWGCQLQSHAQLVPHNTFPPQFTPLQNSLQVNKGSRWVFRGQNNNALGNALGLLWLLLSVTRALSIHYLIEYKCPDYIKS